MSRALKFAVPALSVVLMGACASTGSSESKANADAEAALAAGMAPTTAEQIAEMARADPLTRANFWAAEFRKHPEDLETTIQFTTSLREIGSHARAIDVLTSTIPAHPKSDTLRVILGRALMSEGRPGEAADAYYRASVINPQNAAAYAGLGLALDQMERHFDAQAAYAAALQIEPDRVSTLTNYGLSLALSGQLVKAEERLRYASTLPGADVRVRQNLALILGLQGRFEDMREVDPHAPKRTVESNLDTLRSMMAPTRTYEALKEETAPEEDAPAQAPQEKAESSLRLRGALGSD